MNPLQLVARNYRCFAELDLRFPDGCVAVLGDNGAGKSSIVNAVDVAIFGARSLADLLTDSSDGGELLLELELEHAGELYRIRRTYSARGRGKTTLDFEKLSGEEDGKKDPPLDGAFAPSAQAMNVSPPRGSSSADSSWMPLTCASTKETQELIEATLGLSRETFRASAFLAQGDGAAFTDAQPRDRKRILGQVLGLDRYDRLQERARQDRRSVEAELLLLDGRTATAREQVESKPALVVERDVVVEQEAALVAAVAERERERDAIAADYQQAREHAGRRQAAEAELAGARAALERVETLARQVNEARIAVTGAQRDLAVLPKLPPLDELQAREAEIVQQFELHLEAVGVARQVESASAAAVRERADLITRAQAATDQADALTAQAAHVKEGALDSCPTCKQALGAAARKETLDTLTAQAQTLIGESAALLEEAKAVVLPDVPAVPDPPTGLDEVRATIAAVHETSAQRATLDERIRQCEATIAADPDLPERLAEAHELVQAHEAALAAVGEAPVLSAIEAAGQRAAERLRAEQSALFMQRDTKARLDERLAQIAAAERLLADAAAERKTLDGSLAVAVALERAFGPSGIPTLIVENSAIPYLETEANRILDQLGTSFRVELRTQAELKSGDGLRDTLDVIVSTEQGERAYETFSGGERTRINLGLRIALARLLANRRGAESRLLAIDEPDGLDEHGMAALVEVLRGLDGDFAKLYVVSHVPALRDSFDTTLTVIRDGESSHVVGGVDASVVAA